MLIHGAVHRPVPNVARRQASAIERANTRLGCTLRRCRARDHRAVLNGRRRRGDMRSDVYRAERAVRRRLDSDGVGHLRASQRSRRQVCGSAVDGLAAHEGAAIGRGHGVHVVRIHEIDVANVRVEDISVADKGIAFVDPLKELVAAVEPRKERFAEA
jgi:hypothetical protein